ncbi:MAG: phage holin [Clostridia bacterium]|nr:phage holin [Clostridia bacterium]MBP3560531.1 phage holin [Clostridia bacterium]
MKINWKARFKNKAFLITFITLIIAFAYQVLGLFDIVPSISEDSIVNFLTIIINILATLGVVVDPTTDGINDSDRAMTYFTDYDERMVE